MEITHTYLLTPYWQKFRERYVFAIEITWADLTKYFLGESKSHVFYGVYSALTICVIMK